MLSLLLLPCFSSFAMTSGRVVGVLDGDTVDVLTEPRTVIRVRLSGIDAPEKRQPFGNAAKKALSDLVFEKQVKVEGTKADRYGRLIGKLLLNGQDVNIQLVEMGLAWHFKRYEREQPPDDRDAYDQAERRARGRKLGLWGDLDPIPPWESRSRRGAAMPRRFDFADLSEMFALTPTMH